MSVATLLASIPTSWELPPLEELITTAIAGDWGSDPDVTDPDYEAVLCIRASELRHWKSERGSTAALRKVKKSRLQGRQLHLNDLLVEISGGGPDQPVGRTVLVDVAALSHNSEIPKVCSNFMRRVCLSSHISAHFVNYYLLFFYKTGEIVQFQGGSNNLRNLKFGQFIEIKVPFPPLPEQRRIVAKIEELFSELDQGVENLKQARAQLAVYRQSLLKHAFEGHLTAAWRKAHASTLESAETRKLRSHPIKSWGLSTLGELTEYITSGSRGWAEYYSDSGALFIRAQNLNRDTLDLSDIAYVKLPDRAEGTRTLTRVGDVFITITGANVTKAGYLDRDIGEAYVSQHVALCRPLDPSLSEFLYLYIISNAGGRRDLEKAAYGAGKPGLNLENVRTLSIPVPSREEVPVIVASIRSNLSAIEALEADIHANLRKAEALRQAILKKAFAGELVPQDPADEPAPALLARLRSARATTPATPRRGRKPAPTQA